MSVGAAAVLALGALGCVGLVAWCAVQIAGIKAAQPGDVAELRREVHAIAAELDDLADWTDRRQRRDAMRERRSSGGAKLPSGNEPEARLARMTAQRARILAGGANGSAG